MSSDPLAVATTFTITCSGPGGQASQSVLVNLSPPGTTQYSVGGAVIGLTGSLTLQLNGAADLVVSANGAFTFGSLLPNGAAYTVSIRALPAGQSCAVANAGGTINGANVTNVNVTCSAQPPPTVTMTANPGSVAVNGTTTLSWSTTNATSCEAQGSWTGPRATSGSETVGPLAFTTNFALVCTGPGGTNLGVVTVDVIRPPTLSLTTLTDSVNSGREGTVFWRTTGVTSCVAAGGWSGPRAANGEERVAVPSRRTDFTLRCDGPGGSVTERVSIRRNALCQRPEVAFEITPASVASGGSSTLYWYTGNATQCTASGGWSGAKSLMGSETVGPLTADTTFALTCDGDVGRTVYAQRVGINRQAPSIYFQARHSEADPQSTAGNVLIWSVENASSCTASGGWSGGKALFGTGTIPIVTAPTTFGLSCSGNGTTTEAQLTVTPISRANLAPIVRPDVVNVAEDQPFNLLDLGEAYFANDEDPDGCIEDFTYLSKNSWGVWMTTYFEPDQEHMWFRALDDLTGDLREYYTLYDNHGRESDFGVATLRIAGRSDALQLEPDRAALRVGSGAVFISITANDRGIDERASINVSRAPTNGSVTLGQVAVGPDSPFVRHYYFARYTPRAGFTGTETFEYEVVNVDSQRASTTVTVDVRTSACVADGSLTAPLGGIAGVDWRAIQFPDVQSVAGQAADGRGGPFVRDQGQRTDFLVGDLDDTYRPIAVRAMQCGRVIGAGDDFIDNTPSDTVPDAALLACGNSITIERHDGTRDRYCNLRYQSGGPAVGDEVMEGQYLGRAGYSAGYPGVRVEVTAPDGRSVDLLSAPGAFDLAYPANPQVLAFGVTTTDDPRSQVSPAVLLPGSSGSLDRDAVPVLWYRIYGAPSTTQRRLSIQDGQGTRVWQAQLNGVSSPAGVFAYIAESTATRAVSPEPPRLPPGTYTAILELPSFPSISARTTFTVSN